VDVEPPVGRILDREVAKGEEVEEELRRFTERRGVLFSAENKERAAEAAWAESTRALNEQRRQQARIEWHSHHVSQAERLRNTLEDLARYHEERAEQLLNDGGDAA
jgi:selenocysteine-specific translation elongation factor